MRISLQDVVSIFPWISRPSARLAVFYLLYFITFSAVATPNVPQFDPAIESDFSTFLSSRIESANVQNMAAGAENTISSPSLRLFQNGRLISSFQFQGAFPDQINGSVTLGGRTKRVQFKKNLDLLSPNYKESYVENGWRTLVTGSLSNAKEFCFYHGTVDGDNSTYATLNLCNQSPTGTFYADGTHYVIENLQLLPSHQYFSSSPDLKCGHDSKALSGHVNSTYVRRKRALESQPSYYKKYVTWKELYVELALVFDNSMYIKYGKDKKRLSDRAKDLVNYMNAYYQPVRIKVALVGVEIWAGNDRITINTSGDTTLDQFLRYRRINLIHDMPNDHAQLLTNVTFNGGVVGKAMKGTMCSTDLSGAVVMDHDRFKSAVPIAATMAHEMGHNFGMEHDSDTCECPQLRCLMAASSSGAGNAYWSSCSMEYLSLSISHGADYCLRNRPPVGKEQVCGNGFVEDGEECDCGLPDVCENPCCNPNTCRFAPGAVCANGGCCDVQTCQFMPLATVCRDSENECDLPEFCNGKSELCPKNTYKQNGVSCDGNKAFCHNGTCGAHDSQCKLIWGPTGQMAARECYILNEKGDAQGHCGLDRHHESFVRCEREHSMCGLLQCTHKTERTSYGDRSVVRMTSAVLHSNDRFLNCHTAMIDLGFDRPNPGLVPNGAKCGDGKMCQGQKCVPITDVLVQNPCPFNCHDSGVCNNLGHCHCVSGYGGVDCSIPGLGGSIDSGPAATGAGRFNVGIGILIFLLVVLPLITAAVTLLYKKGIIKAPRFKIIDLLFKPRRSKSRPASAVLSDVGQNRTRTFDANSISKKAPPVLSFPPDPPQHKSPQIAARETTGIIPLFSATPPVTTYSNTSAVLNPVVSYDSVSPKPVGMNGHQSSPAPPRPARPKDEVLEKLYYTDVSSMPRVDYAGVKRNVEPPTESLLSEVLTALEPEYGAAILPQRRAPPPPPIEEEPVEANAEEPEANGIKTAAASVKDKKRFFESASSANMNSGQDKDSPATLKRPPKDSALANGTKAKGADRKAPEISDPLDPKIGGEPVTQASSLLVVSHLESQTLPRKKNSDGALSTGAAYRARLLNQRKSTAIEAQEWKKGRPTSNIVQRSQSSVSGCRPSIAPPPPPPQPPVAAKPTITPKPSTLSVKPSSRGRKEDPASTVPLVSNENFDSDSESSLGDQGKRRSASNTTENYYDVIASPVDEKEEIYADIDEFRAAIKSQPPAPARKRSDGSSPTYRSLFPSAPASKPQSGSGKLQYLESKKPDA